MYETVDVWNERLDKFSIDDHFIGQGKFKVDTSIIMTSPLEIDIDGVYVCNIL